MRNDTINNILTDPTTDDYIYNGVMSLNSIKTDLSPLHYDIYTLTRLFTIKQVAQAYQCSMRLICYKLSDVKKYLNINANTPTD